MIRLEVPVHAVGSIIGAKGKCINDVKRWAGIREVHLSGERGQTACMSISGEAKAAKKLELRVSTSWRLQMPLRSSERMRSVWS